VRSVDVVHQMGVGRIMRLSVDHMRGLMIVNFLVATYLTRTDMFRHGVSTAPLSMTRTTGHYGH
jgi:hypothetical protein